MIGITVTSIHTDNRFKKVRELLRSIHFEISARNEQVGDIEIEVKTLKEQYQCTTESVQYKRTTIIMI